VRRRRLALSVLLGAAALAVAAYPVRGTWWGGWILAVAEAGIVGGLADWFAVTALFRRPLGLPIPHTALIPANWELLAARVGTMVGERVLTLRFLLDEIARLDVGGWLARAAERLERRDLEAATRAVVREAAAGLSPAAAGELAARVQRLLRDAPLAPALARALELACDHGWVERAAGALARALAGALEREEVRAAVTALVDEVLARYRDTLPLYPRLALGVADALGFVDRARIVGALHAGLRELAADDRHPVRRRLAEEARRLAARLRAEPALGARVEALKAEWLGGPVAARLVPDAAGALRRALLTDVARPDSEVVAWLVDRLERWRRALLADATLRARLDEWVKARAAELVTRYHGRLATFIEKGVHALGPEGAVRLVEEHAGDDLQFIRVNGTVVGGLAGGLLYGIHLLLHGW